MQKKNKEDTIGDSFFWPIMADLHTDHRQQPLVDQPYNIHFRNSAQQNDKCVYSLYLHFLQFCAECPGDPTGAFCGAQAQSLVYLNGLDHRHKVMQKDPKCAVNSYTLRGRLSHFIKLGCTPFTEPVVASETTTTASHQQATSSRIEDMDFLGLAYWAECKSGSSNSSSRKTTSHVTSSVGANAGKVMTGTAAALLPTPSLSSSKFRGLSASKFANFSPQSIAMSSSPPSHTSSSSYDILQPSSVPRQLQQSALPFSPRTSSTTTSSSRAAVATAHHQPHHDHPSESVGLAHYYYNDDEDDSSTSSAASSSSSHSLLEVDGMKDGGGYPPLGDDHHAAYVKNWAASQSVGSLHHHHRQQQHKEQQQQPSQAQSQYGYAPFLNVRQVLSTAAVTAAKAAAERNKSALAAINLLTAASTTSSSNSSSSYGGAVPRWTGTGISAAAHHLMAIQ